MVLITDFIVVTVLSSLCCCVSTTSIAIDNAGFETDGPLLENTYEYDGSIISNWVTENPYDIPSLSCIDNPTGGTALNDPMFEDSSPEGILSAFLMSYGPSGHEDREIAIFQTLTAHVTVNTTYTLKVYVGNMASSCWSDSTDGPQCWTPDFSGYRVTLLGNTKVLAQDDNTLRPGDGEWMESVVTVTILPGNTNIGKQLAIRLISKNADCNYNCAVAFDDVRLDAFYFTRSPTALPTQSPTLVTLFPTQSPTSLPTPPPASLPTQSPSSFPSYQPTQEPTVEPTIQPTVEPSVEPTVYPSVSSMESTETAYVNVNTLLLYIPEETTTSSEHVTSTESTADEHVQLRPNNVRSSDILMICFTLALISVLVIYILCKKRRTRRRLSTITTNMSMIAVVGEEERSVASTAIVINDQDNSNNSEIEDSLNEMEAEAHAAEHKQEDESDDIMNNEEDKHRNAKKTTIGSGINPELVMIGSAKMTKGNQANEQGPEMKVKEGNSVHNLVLPPLHTDDGITLLSTNEIVAIVCDAYDQNAPQAVQGPNAVGDEDKDHETEGVHSCEEEETGEDVDHDETN